MTAPPASNRPSPATIATIKQIVARIKRDPALAEGLGDRADLVREVLLDSLEMLQFMLELEEKLAIQIDFDRLAYDDLHAIERLAAFLDTMPRRGAGAPA